MKSPHPNPLPWVPLDKLGAGGGEGGGTDPTGLTERTSHTSATLNAPSTATWSTTQSSTLAGSGRRPLPRAEA